MRDMFDVPALVARREEFKSLEAPFYTSQDVLDLDLDVIFGRNWIFVGSEPEVPEPGDVITVEVGAYSILIMRGDDEELRAFHNVCRHRGAKLIDARNATVGNIVCKYHGWTYNEDGELVLADHMGGDFDPSCHGLKPVHIRSLAGLIFICLAEKAPDDFEQMAETMTRYIGPHQVKKCKVAHQSELIEMGNWKLALENNRECYHCESNHPELTVPISEFGFGFAPDELDTRRSDDVAAYEADLAASHAKWESNGLPSGVQEHLMNTTGFRTMRLPLMNAGESHTMDTKVASKKLLGDFKDAKLGGLTFWTHPNSWHHFMSDHIVTFSVLPLSPGRTLVRTTWLVHEDAVEGVDYDLDNLTKVWTHTNQQDADLVALAQKGAEMPSYQPGPYSRFTEPHVESFAAWYIARLEEHFGLDQAKVAAQ